MPDDIKFLKYKTKILAVNTGDQPDRLTHDIVVPTFRGYAPGDRIPAGTLLSAIIEKEFNSTPPTPKVTITVVGNGTTSPAAGTHNVTYGGDFTFNSATPATGYRLKDIIIDGEAKTAPFTIRNITADKIIAVTFEEITPTPTYTITATAGANGSINPSGAVSVDEGSSQAFTITANSGYQIKDVNVDGTSVGAIGSYQFDNVVADHTIEAEFEAIPADTYTVNVTNNTPTFGTITPASATVVSVGTTTTVTATPNSGYKIKTLTLDGVDQTSPFTIDGVKDQTYNVVVEFEPESAKKLYIGHIVGSRGATVVPTSSNITIVTSEEKTDAELQALKASGWTVVHPARTTFSEYFVAYPAEMGALKTVTSVEAQLPDAYETETFDIDGVSCIIAYHPGCNKSGGEIKYEW